MNHLLKPIYKYENIENDFLPSWKFVLQLIIIDESSDYSLS